MILRRRFPAVLCTSGLHRASLAAGMASAAASKTKKKTQGELVQEILLPSPVPLIDIGVNLGDDSFDKDRDEVVERARQAGVRAIVVTGCNLRSSQRARDLCDSVTHLPLFFTAGFHPHNAKECDEAALEELEQLAAHPRCVAIGETGLDFNRNFSPPDVQERWFDAQVALATRLGKPLFMHCRDAGERFAAILGADGARGDVAGCLHCFTGSAEELQQCLALGLHIGITGWVCDDRPERGGAELAALLSTIPQNRLMIETDAPYLVPRTIKPSKARPGRNEPALLPYVLAQVAEALGEAQEVVAARTTQVACQFFNLPAEIVI